MKGIIIILICAVQSLGAQVAKKDTIDYLFFFDHNYRLSTLLNNNIIMPMDQLDRTFERQRISDSNMTLDHLRTTFGLPVNRGDTVCTIGWQMIDNENLTFLGHLYGQLKLNPRTGVITTIVCLTEKKTKKRVLITRRYQIIELSHKVIRLKYLTDPTVKRMYIFTRE